MWIIAGSTGSSLENDVWSSVNGNFWIQQRTSAPFSARSEHSSVVFDGGIWVIAGYTATGSQLTNDVWYSFDGISWDNKTQTANFSKRQSHSSVVFNNKIWVIGGGDNTSFYNDVWYSE